MLIRQTLMTWTRGAALTENDSDAFCSLAGTEYAEIGTTFRTSAQLSRGECAIKPLAGDAAGPFRDEDAACEVD